MTPLSVTSAVGGLCIVFASLLLANKADAAHFKSVPDACLSDPAFLAFENRDLLTKVQRGFNLPNWDREDLSERPKRSSLERLKMQGLTHVRLPVFHASFNHDDLNAPVPKAYMEAVAAQVDYLNTLGFAVSVDLHPDRAFNTLYSSDPNRGLAQLAEIWRTLARHLTDTDPDNVLIELLNEPDTSETIWAAHAEFLIEMLRELLPDHTFVVGASGPQRYETLAALVPYDDRNIIYAAHYYDPFFFTHQGASWLPESNPERALYNVPFPASVNDPQIVSLLGALDEDGNTVAHRFVLDQLEKPWRVTDIEAAFDRLQEWSRTHERPIIVNEFGVLSHNARKEDRARWISVVVTALEARCIAWTHWEFSDGFGFVSPVTGKADPDILRALLSGLR